jgi:hypothetical protein
MLHWAISVGRRPETQMSHLPMALTLVLDLLRLPGHWDRQAIEWIRRRARQPAWYRLAIDALRPSHQAVAAACV